MDDLIVAILGAIAFAFVAAVAIFVAIATLMLTATGTSVWALARGVGSFTGNFVTSIGERGGTRRTPRDPEPAFELYVLGQLFADYRFALAHAVSVLAEVRKQLSAFADRWSEGATLPLSIGAVLGGYIGTGVAGLVGVLAGVCVGLVVALAAAASWVLIGGLRLADALRRRVRHASYECPEDHERFSLPVYICPSCGAEHARLVPGRWGIFKRECGCGKTALPTTVINGRQRVPQHCPSGHTMSGFLGYAQNLPVAIVGGPSSGKSTFLAGALIELDDPTTGVSLEPLSESRSAYSKLVDGMRSGIPPEKTTNERAPALVAEVQGSGRSRALYAYDVAGEVYEAEDKVRGLQFLARSAGIVLLVDPFSIPRVAADHADELATVAQHVLPSSQDPMHVFERLLATLTEAGSRTTGMPLAIVLAKTDACGIDDEIERLATAVGFDQAPRAWLEANGAGNLVRTIDQQFKHVGWFSISALGRMPAPGDNSAFVPRGSLAPLLWILARCNIHMAKQAPAASHTAQRLLATAADFPPPTSVGRAWRAATAAILATAALVVPAIAATQRHGSPEIAGGSAPDITAEHGASNPRTTSPGSVPASRSKTPPSHKRRRHKPRPKHRPTPKVRAHRRAAAARRRTSQVAGGGAHPDSSSESSRQSSPGASRNPPANSTPGSSGGLQGSAQSSPPAGTTHKGGSGGLHGAAEGHSGGGAGLSGSAEN